MIEKMRIGWHLEVRNIDELMAHPRNPRYISKEDTKQLKRSIAKFGLIDKPIITYDGMIIGGHQRISILDDMGWTEVECWVCNSDTPFTEEEIDELNIRLNKNTGDWDWDKLANEWDISLLCEWGFKEEDFDDHSSKIKKPKVTFEFEDSEELKEFVDKMNDFPSKEDGLWSYKMKVKV